MAALTAGLAAASSRAGRARLPALASTASGLGSIALGLAWTVG